MPVYPKVPIRGVTTQRTVTFRGVHRHDRIREGEWYMAENLSSAAAPMLSVRKKRSCAAHVGGTVLSLAPSDPAAVLYRAENDPDTVILCYGDETASFPCGADRDPGPIVRMGALLVLPALGVTVNTATGERGRLGTRFTPSDTEICKAYLDHPCVLKVCPCDAEGNELHIARLLSPEDAERLESDPDQIEIDPGKCYAVGTQKTIRRFLKDEPEKWQTVPHLLRVEAAGIGAAGFRAGDFVEIAGLPVAWTDGVFVYDMPHDAVDPIFMGYNRNGAYDDDPNGLREIAMVGEDYIVVKDVFYTRTVTADYNAAQSAVLGRPMPEMDFVVEAQNRLWGCRCGLSDGRRVNELYASALGDCTAWQRFNGLSTASWTASVGSEGPFTGAAVLDGCPVFFKETCVHRVYPSATGAHRVTEQRIMGVAPGCANSIVPFEGGLAYVSHAGVMRWSGGAAVLLSEALGTLRPVRAAAGVWGRKLYLSLTEAQGEGGAVWDLNGRDGDEEDVVHFSCTSGLIGYTVTEQKYISRLSLRLILPRGSRMDVWLEYDSDGVWRHAGHLRGQGTGSFLLPVRPRRCDHFRLRLTGEGDARLYSIAKHLTKGSDKP